MYVNIDSNSYNGLSQMFWGAWTAITHFFFAWPSVYFCKVKVWFGKCLMCCTYKLWKPRVDCSLHREESSHNTVQYCRDPVVETGDLQIWSRSAICVRSSQSRLVCGLVGIQTRVLKIYYWQRAICFLAWMKQTYFIGWAGQQSLGPPWCCWATLFGILVSWWGYNAAEFKNYAKPLY